MKEGEILAEGSPVDVIDEQLVKDVYGIACEVMRDPVSDTPMIVPRGRHHAHPSRA